MRYLPDVDLSHRHVSRAGVRVVASVTRCRKLSDGHAPVDPLAGLLEGEKRAVDVLEGDEAVSLRLPGLLVENDYSFLELAVGREEAAEAVRGGVPSEAADK